MDRSIDTRGAHEAAEWTCFFLRAVMRPKPIPPTATHTLAYTLTGRSAWDAYLNRLVPTKPLALLDLGFCRPLDIVVLST